MAQRTSRTSGPAKDSPVKQRAATPGRCPVVSGEETESSVGDGDSSLTSSGQDCSLCLELAGCSESKVSGCVGTDVSMPDGSASVPAEGDVSPEALASADRVCFGGVDSMAEGCSASRGALFIMLAPSGVVQQMSGEVRCQKYLCCWRLLAILRHSFTRFAIMLAKHTFHYNRVPCTQCFENPFVSLNEFHRCVQRVPVIVEEELRDVGTSGTSHFHESPIGAPGQAAHRETYRQVPPARRDPQHGRP